jgi:hypothetical protein
MAGRKPKRITAGQELISFDGPLTINTQGYDTVQAKQAALHRHRRKGELALTPRTRGFLGMVSSLWVPHSGTENSAVVAFPENYVRQNKLLIRDKVIEKYKDSDKSLQQIMLWAYFASHQVGKELRQKFDAYIFDGREGYLRIHAGLGPDGEIVRERIEEHEVAHRGIKSYLIHLQAFVGAPEVLGKGERRKWPQERHHKDYAQRLEWAGNYLDRLPEYEFAETVKEAYYSERSRHEFWTFVRNTHVEYLKDMHRRQMVAASIPLPIEAYDNHPRADGLNYIDNEYIG